MAGSPIPVRDPETVAEMTARYAALRRKCFQPTPAPVVAPPSRTMSDADIAASIQIYGKPDLRTAQQRAGVTKYSGRHCLLIVVSVTEITADQIANHNNTICFVKARGIASFLMRHYACKSLPQIGVMLDRDHTSILNAIRRTEAAITDLGLPILDDPVEMAEALWSREWPAHAIIRERSRARPPGSPRPC